jgi:hypothetical protein
MAVVVLVLLAVVLAPAACIGAGRAGDSASFGGSETF